MFCRSLFILVHEPIFWFATTYFLSCCCCLALVFPCPTTRNVPLCMNVSYTLWFIIDSWYRSVMQFVLEFKTLNWCKYLGKWLFINVVFSFSEHWQKMAIKQGKHKSQKICAAVCSPENNSITSKHVSIKRMVFKTSQVTATISTSVI